MKKLILSLALTAGFAVGSYAQITGTAHDFSGSGWSNNINNEICIACHTPHGANTTVVDAPLWNHQLSSISTYLLYSSGTLDATVGQPDGSSKLCLSCHDGSVALENFGTFTTGTQHVAGIYKIGAGWQTPNVNNDLSNDHPISFTYNTALSTTDGGLFDPSDINHTTALGGTIDNDLLISGKMQCSSCHDVHGTVYNSLLKIDPAGSALCLTCHNK